MLTIFKMTSKTVIFLCLLFALNIKCSLHVIAQTQVLTTAQAHQVPRLPAKRTAVKVKGDEGTTAASTLVRPIRSEDTTTSPRASDLTNPLHPRATTIQVVIGKVVVVQEISGFCLTKPKTLPHQRHLESS